jgi:hypothetical protein
MKKRSLLYGSASALSFVFVAVAASSSGLLSLGSLCLAILAALGAFWTRFQDEEPVVK